MRDDDDELMWLGEYTDELRVELRGVMNQLLDGKIKRCSFLWIATDRKQSVYNIN